VFTHGCDKKVFETAKEMVVNGHYIYYSHLGSDYGKTGYELEYWQTSQTRGAVSVVRQVLHTYNKIKL
jgi:hypothetical protein